MAYTELPDAQRLSLRSWTKRRICPPLALQRDWLQSDGHLKRHGDLSFGRLWRPDSSHEWLHHYWLPSRRTCFDCQRYCGERSQSPIDQLQWMRVPCCRYSILCPPPGTPLHSVPHSAVHMGLRPLDTLIPSVRYQVMDTRTRIAMRKNVLQPYSFICKDLKV